MADLAADKIVKDATEVTEQVTKDSVVEKKVVAADSEKSAEVDAAAAVAPNATEVAAAENGAMKNGTTDHVSETNAESVTDSKSETKEPQAATTAENGSDACSLKRKSVSEDNVDGKVDKKAKVDEVVASATAAAPTDLKNGTSGVTDEEAAAAPSVAAEVAAS